ncbi:hypothetical protein AB849_001120 [Thermoactinomyces vulgaris]|nr:hypothetical protein AB849_001120 [Thermoactinomyces vulgaris]
MLLKMGEQVEVSIHKVLKAFEKREVTVAQGVIREDHHVDEMEEKIDDTVVKLIATQQPGHRSQKDIQGDEDCIRLGKNSGPCHQYCRKCCIYGNR